MLGTPNSEAEAALRPIVEHVFSGDAMPNYTFECRDVACRLTIVEDKDAGPGGWRGALEKNADLRLRVSNVSFHGSDMRDLRTKASLRETRVYFRLVDVDAGSNAGMVR